MSMTKLYTDVILYATLPVTAVSPFNWLGTSSFAWQSRYVAPLVAECCSAHGVEEGGGTGENALAAASGSTTGSVHLQQP